MEETTIATAEETVTELLSRSGRPATPVRRRFVQGGERGNPSPGPLATFVRHGDEIGLDLLLLVKAVASAEPWNVTQHAEVWARALRHTGRSVTAAGLSKVWRRLEERQMLSRARRRRLVDVTLLKEDGSGEAYAHPGRQAPAEAYFKLAHAYWTEGWCGKLGLPAKAMLLVSLSLRPGFYMPIEKVPDWYGFSADTAQRGLHQLAQAGVLTSERRRKKAPLAPAGYTEDRHYTLVGALSPSTSKEA